MLVVGHHGSMTSFRRAFLDEVGASTFLISVGPTRYASVTLPDQVIVDELTSLGALWRTDLHDATCTTSSAKIGTDNGNQPGGCDNIVMEIAADGAINAHYAWDSD